MKQPLLFTLLLLFPFLSAFAQVVEELDEMPPQQIQLELALEKIEKDGKFGLADPEGRIVIPPLYSAIQYKGFEPNVRVKLDGKFGIIDTDNKILIPLQYDEIRVFIKRTDVYYVESQENGKRRTDIITETGRSILPAGAQFRGLHGAEIMVTIDGKDALVDGESGVYILKPIYDSVDSQGEHYRVCLDGKCGFIDKKTQKVIVPLIYDDKYSYFRNGLVILVLNGKAGVTDQKGNIVIAFEYDKISSGSDNKIFTVRNTAKKEALFKADGKQFTTWYDYITDDIGKQFYYYRQDGPAKDQYKFGYVDKSGKELTGPIFDKPVMFYESDDCIELVKDGQTVYLTKEGKVVKKNCK